MTECSGTKGQLCDSWQLSWTGDAVSGQQEEDAASVHEWVYTGTP